MSDTNSSAPSTLVTLPADWPGQPLPLSPGDGSKYIPQGLGLGGPMLVRPWDNPLQVLTGQNYYGFDPPDSDPIRAAPSNLAAGGVIYFDERLPDESVGAVLSAMEVQTDRRDFAAFKWDAKDTRTERFLTQLRIIAKVALNELFGAAAYTGKLADQALTIEEAILTFLQEERARWNDPRYAFSSRLAGTLGGDGDWAKERLAFGFLVENSYWAVYRVWSRPQLSTK